MWTHMDDSILIEHYFNIYLLLFLSHMRLFGTNVLSNFMCKNIGTSADNMNKTLH